MAGFAPCRIPDQRLTRSHGNTTVRARSSSFNGFPALVAETVP
jgi:hypothetical protein